ncbi:signal peptidase I [Amnibacterium flavum]|uniref:Signal peptidase I n=1 Tax=Amnibacterium flavum TaxID=2173173 RepID=A0A2V1HNB6_9MICO|nr:signal peptidase I [Amnibacterium flavum]PVZ94123.1 signal peptidase I [Amnibacterium flavum]
MTRDTERKERSVWQYLGTGLSAGLLALVVGLGLAVVVVPQIAGATPLTVLTRSMEPTLPPGTLVVVKPTPVDDIVIGDVMTYQIESGKPDVISHRVIEIQSGSDGLRTFITKGDNNDAADEPVIEAQVKGTVWYSIPLIGYVSTNIVGAGRSWIIPVAGAALLAYAALMLTLGLLGRRKRGKRGRRAAEVPAGSRSTPRPAAAESAADGALPRVRRH